MQCGISQASPTLSTVDLSVEPQVELSNPGTSAEASNAVPLSYQTLTITQLVASAPWKEYDPNNPRTIRRLASSLVNCSTLFDNDNSAWQEVSDTMTNYRSCDLTDTKATGEWMAHVRDAVESACNSVIQINASCGFFFLCVDLIGS